MSEFTNTSPPIEFRMVSTGLKRARFDLYPVKDQNTEEHVKSAISWLRKEREMTNIQVRWKLSNDDGFLPEQVPNEAIIADLRTTIGSWEAYVTELEEEIKKIKQERKNEENAEVKKLKKELLKDAEVAHWKQLSEKRQAEATKLRKDISDLVTRLHNQGKDSSGKEVITSIK